MRHLNFCILFAGISAFYSCGTKTTTDTLLAADFLANGQPAIDLLSPTENQQVAVASPKFSWSSRGVSTYLLQVATDSDFANLIIDKEVNGTTYSVQTNDLQGIPSLTTATYYWRVSIAKIKNNLQSSVGTFFLIALPASGSGDAGTIYVDVNSNVSAQLGSKEFPFKGIQAAIEFAHAIRNGNKNISLTVAVAGGAGRSYSESITMKAGISVFGGYSPASQWTRNTALYPTTLNSVLATAVYCGSEITASFTASTKFDGMVVNILVNVSAYGIDIESSAPTISNSTFNIESTGNDAYGVYANGSGGPAAISGNTISVRNTTSSGSSVLVMSGWVRSGASANFIGNTLSSTASGIGTTPYGLHFSNVSGSTASSNSISVSSASANPQGISQNAATISANNNSIRVSGTSGSVPRGIWLTSSSTGSYSGNLIYVTSASATSYGAYIDSSVATMTGNVIRSQATSAGQNATGIHLNSTSGGTYSNNTVSATSALTVTGIAMNITNTGVFTNNLIFTDTGTTRYGFSEGATDDPSNFSNNLIFDTTILYRDEGSVNLNTIGTLCTTLLGNGTSTCAGNLTTGGSLPAVFVAGYTAPASVTTPAHLKSWAILPGGVADISGAGNGWSTGDIGANAATAGP